MRVDYSASILIVDDEQVMVRLTKEVLSKVGFEHIDHPSDGEMALRLLRERKHNRHCRFAHAADKRVANPSHLARTMS